jgi:hypothetical protein
MEVCAKGYLKKIDKFKRLVLVNLEPECVEKLKNVESSLRMCNPMSPILPNGLLLKHDLCSLVYDIDGIPTSTLMLIGQKVSIKGTVKQYRFSNKGKFVMGWSIKMNEMRSV